MSTDFMKMVCLKPEVLDVVLWQIKVGCREAITGEHSHIVTDALVKVGWELLAT
jgi:hypothetical protein